MSRKIRLAMLVGWCVVILAGTMASAAERANQSAVGTWTLDVNKSSYGKMPAPKFEQLVITTDAADALKWSLMGAEPDGKSYTSSYDGPIDSKDHPMTSSEAGSTIAYTRTASGGVRWVVKDKSGATVETATGQLSPNGQTMTIKGTTTTANGKEQFVSIFDKVK
jgi:hypothetical protein